MIVLGILATVFSLIVFANYLNNSNEGPNKNRRLWDYVTAAGTTNYYDAGSYPPTRTQTKFPIGTKKVTVFFGIKMAEPNGELAVFDWRFDGKRRDLFTRPIQNGYNYLEISDERPLEVGEHEVLISMKSGKPLAAVFFVID
jgi:hypothetical protein